MKSLKHLNVGGGVGLALSILFVNAAFADTTTDARIQAYKANKLISTNIVLPTSTTATDSQEYVVFNVNTLSWQKQTKPKYDYSSLIDTYAEWTTQDITAYLESLNRGGYGNQWQFMTSDTMDDVRMYLSGIANGDITSNIDIVYECHDYSGTLTIEPDEVEDLRFFPPDEIPEEIFLPVRRPITEWVKSRRQTSE